MQTNTFVHAWVTGDNLINLMALDHASRTLAPAGSSVVLVAHTSPGMMKGADTLGDAARVLLPGVRVDVPPLPAALASPEAVRDHLIASARPDGHHVWAYAGGTKVMSIGMWLAAAALAARHPGHHTRLYSDFVQGGWLVDDRPAAMDLRVPPEALVALAGGRVEGEPTRLVEPNRRDHAAVLLPDEPPEQTLTAAKRALARGEAAWKDWLEVVKPRVPDARGNNPRAVLVERLVAARALPLLATSPQVTWALANLHATAPGESGDLGEFDVLWVSPRCTVHALDAKSRVGEGNPSKGAADRHRAQAARVHALFGRLATLTEVRLAPRDKAKVPSPPRGLLPPLLFDGGTAFEEGLTRLLQEAR